MTFYEHAMVGMNGALALGLQRRHGWSIAAWSAFAAVLPDWDGLSLLCGFHWYAVGHRFWGHNLLVAGFLAAVASCIAYRTNAPIRIQKWLAKRWKVFSIPGDADGIMEQGWCECGLWILVGVLASYSHLLMDVFCSGSGGQPTWGVPLSWPFSNRMWSCPLLAWGNIGATVIFAASMFAMLRWKRHVQGIAAISLGVVGAYLVFCGFVGGH